MGCAVGNRYDIDLTVDMIAIFQNRTKRRRPAGGLKNDRAILSPLMARVLAIRNALDRPEVDIQPFLFKKALIMGNPHGRQIHGQRGPKHNDLFF